MLFLMQVVQRPFVLTVADLLNMEGRNLKMSINTMGQRHDIDTRELNCAARFYGVFLNEVPWSCYHKRHRE